MDQPEQSPLETAIMTFFRHRDANRLVKLFTAEPVAGRWRAETVLTLPVFLAHLLDFAPDIAEALVAAIKGGDPVKVEVVAQALNYSHHARRRRLMEALAGEAAAGGMDDDGADFLAFVPTHPVHVDMLWVSFFATGDTRFVDHIADLLAGWLQQPELQALLAVAARDPSVQERALAGILADNALWSLTINARDMPEIRHALSAYAGRLDGLAAAMAARILAGITAQAATEESR